MSRGFWGDQEGGTITTGGRQAAEDGRSAGEQRRESLKEPDYLRLRYGFILVLVSVCLVAGIFAVVYGLHIWRLQRPPEDLSAAMAAATGVIGTLVGTFFGHQLGAAGKERAERRAEEARSDSESARRENERERVRRAVDANLTSGQAEKLLEQLEQTWSEPPR